MWQRSSRCVWAAKADGVHSGACAEKHIGGRVAALSAACLGGQGRPSPHRRLRWKAHRRSRGSAHCGVSGWPRPTESTSAHALESTSAALVAVCPGDQGRQRFGRSRGVAVRCYLGSTGNACPTACLSMAVAPFRTKRTCVYVDTSAVQTVVFQFRLVSIDVWLSGSLRLLQELCFRVLCVDFKNCVAGFSAFTSKFMCQGSLR